MTDTAHGDKFLCFFDRVFEIFCAVHGKRRGQFFVGERFALIDNFHFTNQDLSGRWNGETGQFSDFISRLTNNSGVERAIFQDNVLNGFQLFALKQVTAVAGETLTNRIVDRINYNNGLFRSTDNAVIEGFRHQYGCHCAFNISSFINHNRGVTCTNTDRRFTGAVRRFYHAWAASGEDQVDIRVVH